MVSSSTLRVGVRGFAEATESGAPRCDLLALGGTGRGKERTAGGALEWNAVTAALEITAVKNVARANMIYKS